MTNFDVQVIFDENGKTFDTVMCDIINTFLIKKWITTFQREENKIYYDSTIYHSN